jgi:hypothetical protein
MPTSVVVVIRVFTVTSRARRGRRALIRIPISRGVGSRRDSQMRHHRRRGGVAASASA